LENHHLRRRLTSRGFIAPYVIDGAMNGRLFQAWVAQMLTPELRQGDLVIMRP
jgi:hypothetical protein